MEDLCSPTQEKHTTTRMGSRLLAIAQQHHLEKKDQKHKRKAWFYAQGSSTVPAPSYLLQHRIEKGDNVHHLPHSCINSLTHTDKGKRSEHGEHHCLMPAPLTDTQILANNRQKTYQQLSLGLAAWTRTWGSSSRARRGTAASPHQEKSSSHITIGLGFTCH